MKDGRELLILYEQHSREYESLYHHVLQNRILDEAVLWGRELNEKDTRYGRYFEASVLNISERAET
jgi:hypothetical protein